MRGWHCNGGLAAALVAFAACSEEPVAPSAPDAAATVAQSAPDAAPPSPAVPVAPLTLLTRLPQPPAIVAVPPGASGRGLRKARPALAPSTYTDRVLQERLTADGGFRRVAYQLGADDRVQAVVLTFAEPYGAPDRWQAVLDAATTRLGAGAAFVEAPYEGVRWAVPGWRIDLRHDRATGDRQLLFHERGGRDLGLP